MYRAETLDLLQAIQDDRPAQVPIEEGVRSLCFALAAAESAQSKRPRHGRDACINDPFRSIIGDDAPAKAAHHPQPLICQFDLPLKGIDSGTERSRKYRPWRNLADCL